MPRRNNRKIHQHVHAPSVYDEGFKQECHGCAFAGTAFRCLSSDGKCLKIKQGQEVDSAGNRETNRTG